MARPGPPPAGSCTSGRYLGTLLAILVAALRDRGPGRRGSAWLKPKLGLDLQGGAQVILTPEDESGKKVAPPAADRRRHPRQRVNGAGVVRGRGATQGQQTSSCRCPAATAALPEGRATTAQLRSARSSRPSGGHASTGFAAAEASAPQ